MKLHHLLVICCLLLPGLLKAQAPANDDRANAINLTGPLPITTTGSNVGATLEGTETGQIFGVFYNSTVWWKWTAPSTGNYLIDTFGSSFTTVIQIENSFGNVSFGFYSADFDDLNATSFFAVGGEEYFISISTEDFSTQGSIALQLSESPGVPAANDDFANAAVLPGSFPYFETIVNDFSTLSSETGEPLVPDPFNPGFFFEQTAWWTYTPTSTQRLRFRTNDFSSTIGVFTGTALNNLVLVSDPEPTSDYFPPGTTVKVDAGVTYYIRAAAQFSGFPPFLILDVTELPLNDEFAEAQLVTVGPSNPTINATNASATTEFDEPGAGPEYISDYDHSLWYSFTAAPAGQLLVIDTFGSTIDTVLNVYTGPDLLNLTEVRASDNADSSNDARVAFFPDSATTYYVRVSGATWGEEGPFQLNFTSYAPPPPTATAADHLLFGRAYLEGRSLTDLTSAAAHFAQAVALEPANAEVNVLHAITRIAMLQEDATFKSLMTQWGIQVLDGGLHGLNYETDSDLNGRKAPPAANTSQGQAFLSTTVFNELAAAIANLTVAGAPFAETFSDSEMNRFYATVDHGDTQLLQAIAHALRAAIHMNNTFNSDASIDGLAQLENAGSFDAENVLAALPNALRRRGATDERSQFKTEAQLANTLYQAASTFIRARGDGPESVHHLFRIGSGRSGQEQDLRTNLAAFSGALDGPTTWQGKQVSLTSLLTTNSDYRDLLPDFKGSQVLPETAPDPTFLTALVGGDQGFISGKLLNNEILYNLNDFQQWVALLLGGSPPGDQAPDANPANGALNNLGNWAFVLDPNDAGDDSNAAVNAVIPGTNPNEKFLSVTFKRRLNVPGLIYRVCVSDDLSTWDETEAQVVQVGPAVPQPDGLTEQVTFRITTPVVPATKKFIQVKAIVPTP